MLRLFAVLSVCAGLGYSADFLTGQGARAVIGQKTFTAQDTGASNTILGAVGGLAYAANTLYAADANRLGLLPNNNRVLIFNNIQQQFPAVDAEIPDNSGRCPVCGGAASLVVGQPDFTTVTQVLPPTRASLRLPTALATDGKILAVADTANNRILIWKSIPSTNGQNADIVLGQADFITVARLTVTASALRGPQGVWIQNGKLLVADTQNNRVLIWNAIPTQNNQPADVVLGQPNFTTAPFVNLVDLNVPATAATMLSPTSVTSDGTRLYVSDLGFNRVLIWNSIPTQNQKAADVVIGQPNFTDSIANNLAGGTLCASNGTDPTSGNPTYPFRCAATLSFPRYALSNGTRLFIADGGNDRILVFNTIPARNGARADAVLGEPDEFSDLPSNATLTQSASDLTAIPTSLAWDGENLYVADATDYRILVFTAQRPDLPLAGIVNAASKAVYASGSVTLGGSITEKNTVTVTIAGTAYTYTVVAGDTLEKVALGLTALINAPRAGSPSGDPNAFAFVERGFNLIRLIARKPGLDGNSATLTSTTSASAALTAVASSAFLAGGGSAAQVAPGAVILVRGTNLANGSASANQKAPQLPWELAGAQLYFDGMRLPLFSASPTEIRAQVPFSVTGSSSVAAWVRVKRPDGSVTVTSAIGVPVVEANPGIFADETPGAQEPRVATAIHGSSYATGTISVDGSIQKDDKGTVTIGGNPYVYTVLEADTLATVRDAFVKLINANPDEQVIASAAPAFTRIRLRAKVPGPAGNGITLEAKVERGPSTLTGEQLAITPTNAATCCANVAGSLITQDNPAVPGETIILYATGLGIIGPEEARLATVGRDGFPYTGPASNIPLQFVTATGGATTGFATTAQVISAGLKVGEIGVYEIVLEVSPGVTPNPLAQFSLSQGIGTSNIVVIPVAATLQQ
ncbi:MAG: hypothetical protein EXQ47_09810 [Bryobacterales bacterium]|nr:hypothetical protein [Bryobacterales bacterium]